MRAIVGLDACHADSSACLLVDGELGAAAEEERFQRIKHWAGFPSEAMRYSQPLRYEDSAEPGNGLIATMHWPIDVFIPVAMSIIFAA